ncbi:SPOR domain-containing protein [Chitinimonas sp. BJB300]|uniref:SPOR domain-containing protein n=1 Tax=Chitinimonas sp. BJB300 TaxID=1559339 RepID=UPI0013047BD6|nr:SPOR domain-containing protein [Chitinimonas sp. BJB300]
MANAPISEELTALKKRARRRLVGAIALVLVALIVLWTVMDDRPPQSLLNESVAIVSSTPSLAGAVLPDHAQVGVPPAPAANPTPEVVLVPPAVPVAQAKPVLEPNMNAVEVPKPSPPKVSTTKPVEKVVEKKAESKPNVVKNDPAKLLAGIEDEIAKPQAVRPAPKEDMGTAAKFFLQIGAFADANKAAALQTKAKEVGVAAHTEAIKTDKGDLTRLRAGPFPSRDLAEKAQDKLALAGVASSIVGK